MYSPMSSLSPRPRPRPRLSPSPSRSPRPTSRMMISSLSTGLVSSIGLLVRGHVPVYFLIVLLLSGPQLGFSASGNECRNGLVPYSFEVATDYTGTCNGGDVVSCHFEDGSAGVKRIQVWDTMYEDATFVKALRLETFDGKECIVGNIPANQFPVASLTFSHGEHLQGSLVVAATTFSWGTRIAYLSFQTSKGQTFKTGTTPPTATTSTVLENIDTLDSYLMGFFGGTAGSWLEAVDGIGFLLLKKIQQQYLSQVEYTDLQTLLDPNDDMNNGGSTKLRFSYDYKHPGTIRGAYQIMIQGLEATTTKEWVLDDGESFSYTYGMPVVLTQIPIIKAVGQTTAGSNGQETWEMGLTPRANYTNTQFQSNIAEVAMDLSVPPCSYGSVGVILLLPMARTFQFRAILTYEFVDSTKWQVPVLGDYQGVVQVEPLIDETEISTYLPGEEECAVNEPAVAPTNAPIMPITPIVPTMPSPPPAEQQQPPAVPSVPTLPPVPTPSSPPFQEVSLPTSNPQFNQSPPTAMPSLSVLQVELVQDVIMTLSPWETTDDQLMIKGQNAITWEKWTANHIETHIQQSSMGTELRDVNVGTNIVSQRLVQSPWSSTRSTTTLTSLMITFDVVVSFRSSTTGSDGAGNNGDGTTDTTYNIPRFIFDSWDTTEDRQEYLQILTTQANGLGGAGTGLGDVSDVIVVVPGITTPPSSSSSSDPSSDPDPSSDSDLINGIGNNQNNDTDDKMGTLAIIIGAAVGGIILFVLVGYLVWKKRRTGKSEDVRSESTGNGKSESTGKDVSSDPEMARVASNVTSEIQVEHQDAVSCLGDPPSYYGHPLGAVDDDTVSEDDYYYKYGGHTANSVAPSMADTNDSWTKGSSSVVEKMRPMLGEYVFSDDSSFEEQFDDLEDRFDVVAPSGKLGFVIVTPQGGGIPTVHAIKEDCVLADRVRIGDRLISVDGLDCTAMTGAELSKYVSSKSEQPERLLEFVRVRASNAPAFG